MSCHTIFTFSTGIVVSKADDDMGRHTSCRFDEVVQGRPLSIDKRVIRGIEWAFKVVKRVRVI